MNQDYFGFHPVVVVNEYNFYLNYPYGNYTLVGSDSGFVKYVKKDPFLNYEPVDLIDYGVDKKGKQSIEISIDNLSLNGDKFRLIEVDFTKAGKAIACTNEVLAPAGRAWDLCRRQGRIGATAFHRQPQRSWRQRGGRGARLRLRAEPRCDGRHVARHQLRGHVGHAIRCVGAAGPVAPGAQLGGDVLRIQPEQAGNTGIHAAERLAVAGGAGRDLSRGVTLRHQRLPARKQRSGCRSYRCRVGRREFRVVLGDLAQVGVREGGNHVVHDRRLPPAVAEIQQLVVEVPGRLARDAGVVLVSPEAFAVPAVAGGAGGNALLERVGNGATRRRKCGECSGKEQAKTEGADHVRIVAGCGACSPSLPTSQEAGVRRSRTSAMWLRSEYSSSV